MAAKRAGNYQADAVGDLDPRRIAPAHVNMRRAIRAKGLTQKQFAVAMGIAGSTLDRWLKGDPENAERYRLPNEALVRAAHVLGVSVWYLLDLTDSPDGSGARPLEQHKLIEDFWGKAKDPEKAAPPTDGDMYERIGTDTTIIRWDTTEAWPEGTTERDWAFREPVDGVSTWRLSGTPGHAAPVRERYPWFELEGMYQDARTRCDPEDPESEAALDGYAAWEAWFREDAAKTLRHDLLCLGGDYRDPLAVVERELAYASKTADSEKFDALLARVDADTRGVMGTDS